MKKSIAFVRKLFPQDEYPQLYSKRGFEKSRFRFKVGERYVLMKAVDKEGIELKVI